MGKARPGSIEALLHHENRKAGYILFSKERHKLYQTAVQHRAIGVVYNPAMEKHSNYVPSILSQRYNALLFFDETRALHPLHLYPYKHTLMATCPFSV